MEPLTFWGEFGLAFLDLVANLSTVPQLLALLLLEIVRTFAKRRSGGQNMPPNVAQMKKFEFWLHITWAVLNALPSIVLAISIFFVRF